MMHALARRLASIGLLAVLALAFPVVASATITPPCQGTGTSTSGNVDLTTAFEWHLKSTDTAGGSGSSTVPMKSANVTAYAFGGLGIPIAGGTGKGETSGSVDGVSVKTYAVLGSRFYVAGSASGDGASCSGNIIIVIDDVNPVLTAFGGGALLLFLLCLIGVLLLARSSGGAFLTVISVILGILGGAGLAVTLGQFGALDATSPIGLAFPLVGAVVGAATCGRMGPRVVVPPPVA
jgi:hypothetical protein